MNGISNSTSVAESAVSEPEHQDALNTSNAQEVKVHRRSILIPLALIFSLGSMLAAAYVMQQALMFKSELIAWQQNQQAQQVQDQRELSSLLSTTQAEQQSIESRLVQLGLTLEAVSTSQRQAMAWQLTDPAMVKLMLAQIQLLSSGGVPPVHLVQMLQAWRLQLIRTGIANDHLLAQALNQEILSLSELANFRLDNASQYWQSWQDLIAHHEDQRIQQSKVTELPVDNEQLGGWWTWVSRFIRVSTVETESNELAQRFASTESAHLWRMQANLALMNIRWGLLTGQASLVQESSILLRDQLAQAQVVLPEALQKSMSDWLTWQGWPVLEWKYIAAYLANPTQVVQP